MWGGTRLRAAAFGVLLVASTVLCEKVGLVDLSRRGDSAAIIAALDKGGVDVDETDVYGWTPLFWAVDMGQIDVVRALLARGADPNKGRNGWNALMWAAGGQHADKVIDIMLTEFKMDANAATEAGLSALMVAAKTGKIEVVTKLLDAGANPDAADADGTTALMQAAGEGRLEVVKELASRGASLTRASSNGWTPLVWAAANWQAATVEHILETVPVAGLRALDADGHSPLDIAADRGHAPVVRLLLLKGVGEGMLCSREDVSSALFKAAAKGRTAVVKELLDAGGASASERDARGWTPLMHAAAGGHLAAAEALVAAGARAEEGSAEDARTPLELAQARPGAGASGSGDRKSASLVAFLLQHVNAALKRVGPDLTQLSRMDLVNWICSSSAQQCTVARAFAEAGFDGKAAFAPRLPLEVNLLADGFKLAKWAVQRLQNPQVAGDAEKAGALLGALFAPGMAAGAHVDPADVFRRAAESHNVDIMLQLASRGAVAPSTDIGGKSALHLALSYPSVFAALRPIAEDALASREAADWTVGDVGMWLTVNRQSLDLVRAFAECNVAGPELVTDVLLPAEAPEGEEAAGPSGHLLNGTEALNDGGRLLKWGFARGHVGVVLVVLRTAVGADKWLIPVGPRGETPMLFSLGHAEWAPVAELLQPRIDARLRSTPPSQWLDTDIACWLHAAGAPDLIAPFGTARVSGKAIAGLVGWPPASGKGPAQAKILAAAHVLEWALGHELLPVVQHVTSWASDVTTRQGLAYHVAIHADVGRKGTVAEAAERLKWGGVVDLLRPHLMARLLSIPVESWTTADAINWAVVTGSGHLAPSFRAAGVTGAQLADLGVAAGPSDVDLATGEVDKDPLKDATRVLRWSLSSPELAPLATVVLSSHPEPSRPAWEEDGGAAPSPFEIAHDMGLIEAIEAMRPRVDAELGQIALGQWSVTHVANWMLSAGLAESTEMFRADGVDGRALQMLAREGQRAHDTPLSAEQMAMAVLTNLEDAPKQLAWALKEGYWKVAAEAMLAVEDPLSYVRAVSPDPHAPTLLEIAQSVRHRNAPSFKTMVGQLMQYQKSRPHIEEWNHEDVAVWLGTRGAIPLMRPFVQDKVDGRWFFDAIQTAAPGRDELEEDPSFRFDHTKLAGWALKAGKLSVLTHIIEAHREVLFGGLEDETFLGALEAVPGNEPFIEAVVLPALKQRLGYVAEADMTAADVANWVHIGGKPDFGRALYRARVDGRAVTSMRPRDMPADVSMFSDASPLLREPQGLMEWGVAKGNSRLVKELLGLGLQAGAVDKFGNSLLITAAWNGEDATVKALLAAGAEVDRTNNNGFTALMRASLRGHADVVQTLLEAGADAARTNNRGKSAVELAKEERVVNMLANFARGKSA